MGKKSNKDTLSEIKTKAKSFLDDRKSANNLIDILSHTQSDCSDVVQASVRSLHRIFTTLISTQQMFMERPPTEDSQIKELSKEDQYRFWLRERYADTRTQLLELLSHTDKNIQELSLCTLMKLVEAEGQHPLKKTPKSHLSFPIYFFEQVIAALLSDTHNHQTLLSRFQEFLEYDDVRYYAMKFTLKNLKERGNTGSEAFHQNVYTLLENLTMPPSSQEEVLSNFLTIVPEDTNANFKICTLKEHKKIFTKVWLDFLGQKLSTGLYKQILVSLHEKCMPHMTSPLLLADFLTESYNIGGAISLLALNGLFVLINSYNLNYPDFFGKLYTLLDPSVFHAKYRARFFFLMDLFLSSTHLPAYLVAAFAKKLSRLSLTAPPSGLTIIVPLVYNLVNRHPSCGVLLHRAEAPSDVTEDPFKMEETDPTKCNALESSLWEFKTLQNHYHHGVATEAKKIDLPLAAKETDLSDLLETSIEVLIQKEVKKKLKEDEDIPVTYQPPKSLFGNKDDQFHELWSLE